MAYYNSTGRDLIYATNITGQWTTEVVDSTGDVGITHLVVHADQTVSIAYQDNSNSI